MRPRARPRGPVRTVRRPPPGPRRSGVNLGRMPHREAVPPTTAAAARAVAAWEQVRRAEPRLAARVPERDARRSLARRPTREELGLALAELQRRASFRCHDLATVTILAVGRGRATLAELYVAVQRQRAARPGLVECVDLFATRAPRGDGRLPERRRRPLAPRALGIGLTCTAPGDGEASWAGLRRQLGGFVAVVLQRLGSRFALVELERFVALRDQFLPDAVARSVAFTVSADEAPASRRTGPARRRGLRGGRRG